MDYKFFNFPKSLSEKDYELSRKKLVNIFCQSDDLRGIFEYGSTQNFGISDLDIIIVLKNKISKNASSFFSKNNLSEETLVILDYASLIILPESKFDQILIWDNLKLNQIYGKRIEFKIYNSLELKIARIIDWLPERIIRIEECLNSMEINVRKALGLLKSSCYTLKNLQKDFNISNVRYKKNILEVDELRRNWFSLNKIEREELLIKQLKISKINLLASIKEFELKVSNIFNLKEPYEVRNIKLNFANKFSFKYKNNSLNKYLKFNKLGLVELNLPYLYLMHFINYSNEFGLISNNLRESIYPKFSYQESYFPQSYKLLLRKRISLCNYWASYLKLNNFDSGLFKMAWFFK